MCLCNRCFLPLVEALDMGPNLLMPLIETLHWDLFDELASVVQRTPNLMVIHQIYPYCPPIINIPLTPKLRLLTIGYQFENRKPFMGSCLQLQELRMKCFKLTATLANELVKCPNLRLLELSMFSMNVNNLLQLLTKLSLQELIVFGLDLSDAAVIAAAPSSVRRLTFRGTIHSGRDEDAFVTLLELFLDVEYLRVHGFVFSRKHGKLDMRAFDLAIFPLQHCLEFSIFVARCRDFHGIQF